MFQHDPANFVHFSGPAQNTRSRTKHPPRVESDPPSDANSDTLSFPAPPPTVLDLASALNQPDASDASTISSLNHHTLPYFHAITPCTASWRSGSYNSLPSPSPPLTSIQAQGVVADDVHNTLVITGNNLVFSRDLVAVDANVHACDDDGNDNDLLGHDDVVIGNNALCLDRVNVVAEHGACDNVFSVVDDGNDNAVSQLRDCIQTPRIPFSRRQTPKPLRWTTPDPFTYAAVDLPSPPLHPPMIALPVSGATLHLARPLPPPMFAPVNMSVSDQTPAVALPTYFNASPQKPTSVPAHIATLTVQNASATEDLKPFSDIIPLQSNSSPKPTDALIPHLVTSPTEGSSNSVTTSSQPTAAASSVAFPRLNPSRSALFCPPHYDGTSNARDWHFQLTQWYRFNAISDNETKIATFALLLTSAARTWFRSLSLPAHPTFEYVSELFLSRFTMMDKEWAQMAQLWSKTQGQDQNALEFISEMLVAASALDVDSKTLYNVAIYGLKPAIRQAVLIHGAKDLDSLIASCKLIETSAVDSNNSNAPVLKALASMQQQLLNLQQASIAPVRNDAHVTRVTFQVPDETGAQFCPVTDDGAYAQNADVSSFDHYREENVNYPGTASFQSATTYQNTDAFNNHRPTYANDNDFQHNSFPNSGPPFRNFKTHTYHPRTDASRNARPRQHNYFSNSGQLSQINDSSRQFHPSRNLAPAFAPRNNFSPRWSAPVPEVNYPRAKHSGNNRAFAPRFNRPPLFTNNTPPVRGNAPCTKCASFHQPYRCPAWKNLCANCWTENHLSTCCPYRPTRQE